MLSTFFLSVIFYSSLLGGLPESLDNEGLPVDDIENHAFVSGEKLTFGIYYQFIRVGSAVMEVKDTVDVDGFKAIHIQTQAKSAKFFDSFYKVRDEINTYLDADRFFSRKFSKRIREGSYFVDVDIRYDYLNNKLYGDIVRYSDFEKKIIQKDKSKSFEAEITGRVFDVLASFYFTRLRPLEPGIPIKMLSNDNEKLYPIIVFSQKRETVKTSAGKFKTILIIPKLQGKAIFEQKGQILIWLTDDQYRIPVKVESKLYFGSIYVELEKIEGPVQPLPSQLR